MKTIKGRYYYYRARGFDRVSHGDFRQAESLFEKSLYLAEQSGSDYLRDIAVCNIAACRIERGISDDDKVKELKEMFMRTNHPKVARLATYHLARMYEIQKDFKKAFFYARISLEKSRLLGRSDYLASSLNQTANLLVAESHFEEASRLYTEAMGILHEASETVRFALIEDNWGYCQMMQGKIQEGVAAVQSSLERLERLQAGPAYLVYPEMDLCYGYLEMDEPARAKEYGERALLKAETIKQDNLVKNLLLLLGDCTMALEDMDSAQSYYGELASFYPGVTTASDFLLAFNVRKVVNLRL
ncbi:MAG TPA: hypothetical protein PK014_06735 [Thermoanaerobaculia bacterium]|nr:hypothetical protein [Thermoanaerobaculia bacterium]HUM29865.1 hypothetical protein [Thermoanaerobaculia bacterium]HXK68140.1 hypothetical protein [Thermoanaerobaculia bacterium]